MKDRQVDTLLRPGKQAVCIHLQHFPLLCSLLSDFMKTPDSSFVRTGINHACMVNKIHILPAYILYRGHNLLRQLFINRIFHYIFPHNHSNHSSIITSTKSLHRSTHQNISSIYKTDFFQPKPHFPPSPPLLLNTV